MSCKEEGAGKEEGTAPRHNRPGPRTRLGTPEPLTPPGTTEGTAASVRATTRQHWGAGDGRDEPALTFLWHLCY